MEVHIIKNSHRKVEFLKLYPLSFKEFLMAVGKEQYANLLEKQDFSKNAPNEIVPKIRMVWNSIASQLAKENKKFIYGLIREGARMGYNDLKNPNAVIRQAKLIQGSEKRMVPDKNGIIKYTTDEIDLGTSVKAVKENGIAMNFKILYNSHSL